MVIFVHANTSPFLLSNMIEFAWPVIHFCLNREFDNDDDDDDDGAKVAPAA